MFSRTVALITLALPVFVAATAVSRHGHGGKCNTGPIQCCNTVGNTEDPIIASQVSTLLGPVIGPVIAGVAANVGLACTAVNIVGIGGGTDCSSQTVCCENILQNGLVNVGCTPVNLGL